LVDAAANGGQPPLQVLLLRLHLGLDTPLLCSYRVFQLPENIIRNMLVLEDLSQALR
jgi:hypothetical protein